MNYFSYMRISTQLERKRQRFDRQENALKKFTEKNGIEFTISFKEDKSGKNFTDRKEWNKLESIVQPGDTIVFKDITRFTREAVNGYEKYMELMNKGVNLIFIDNPTISTSYIKELFNVADQQKELIAKISLESTIKLLLYVELDRAEKERTTLIKRTKDGLAATDKKSGRPFGKLDKMTPELEEDLKLYLSDRSITQISLIKKYNISRNTLKKYANIIKEKEASA